MSKVRPYTASTTGIKYHNSKARCKGIMGPIGCVSGDTLVITENGVQPISSLKSPTRVLSWCEKSNQFVLSLSTGAYPKGADYLYRVLTQQGELVASGHHLVLCSDGSYRRVDTLCLGQSVCLYSDNQSLTNSSFDTSKFPLDVPHYPEKALNCQANYVESVRQYGQQLLLDQGIDPTSVPSQDDAQELYDETYEHMDVLEGLLQERIHRNQL